jgi:hypothetical protein
MLSKYAIRSFVIGLRDAARPGTKMAHWLAPYIVISTAFVLAWIDEERSLTKSFTFRFGGFANEPERWSSVSISTLVAILLAAVWVFGCIGYAFAKASLSRLEIVEFTSGVLTPAGYLYSRIVVRNASSTTIQSCGAQLSHSRLHPDNLPLPLQCTNRNHGVGVERLHPNEQMAFDICFTMPGDRNLYFTGASTVLSCPIGPDQITIRVHADNCSSIDRTLQIIPDGETVGVREAHQIASSLE